MRLPDLAVPFNGERYSARERLSRLIAPPYDVISSSERARLAALDDHNIVHVILPEAPGDKYAHAADVLNQWRAEQSLVRDVDAGVYVLAQDFTLPSGEAHSRVGVFVALAAEGYESRRVRPHERTHAGPKADRLALLRATHTSVESIFVIAPDSDGALDRELRVITQGTPDATASLAGVGIRLWVVAGDDGADLAALVRRDPVYVADGHHRYETASTYARENHKMNRLLALVVSAKDEGLVVLATHRVIHGAPVAPDALAPEWKARFDATFLPKGADPEERLAELGRRGTACVVAWPDGRAEALALKSAAQDVPDVAVVAVEELVVKPIVQRASTAELRYTANTDEALNAVWKSGAAAVVLLNPTKVDEVFRVADAGGIMPPKSTYFVPKVPAGMVFYS
jgi:uncharacterized protein (DUF1015 family)